VVEHAGEILEKPDDDAHAFAMLSKLSGSKHQVHTGVVIVIPGAYPQLLL
jgi:septum formation protein